MGMSMHLGFFRERNDEKLSKMLDAWEACREAGVAPPGEVSEYLSPVIKEFGALDVEREQAIDAMLDNGPGYAGQKEFAWKDEYREGFEVDITKLPEGTRFVRFYCSW